MTDARIALLRGINVGGKNLLPMKDLAAIFSAAGCLDVITYIQSGNVVFNAREPASDELRLAVQSAIKKRFGFEVPVVLRTASELKKVAADNPFLAAGVAPELLHVAFLAATPRASCLASLDPGRSRPDEFILRGRDIFLHLPNGVARTKLSNAYFDRQLETTSTVRNWRTVLKLVALSDR